MKLADHHRDVARLLTAYGIKPKIEPTNGGHVRFQWIAADRKQALVVAKTPSDHRAVQNNIARAKRLLREAGVAPVPQQRKSHASARVEPMADLVARIESLERDVQMLLDCLTAPKPEPKPAPVAAPKPAGLPGPEQSTLLRALRYDDFLPVRAIVKALGKNQNSVACMLTTMKKRGLVQHRRGMGWRKDAKVEQLMSGGGA